MGKKGKRWTEVEHLQRELEQCLKRIEEGDKAAEKELEYIKRRLRAAKEGF